MSFFNSFLKGLTSTDNLRGYDHASKIFGSNALELTPKYSFLFHVYFDLADGITYNKQTEVGLLVKNVELPKYDIATKTLNSYNRPNIIQSKINYQPITITFHDDSANVVRDFWFAYYNYFYRNSDVTETTGYQYGYKYGANLIDKAAMGYRPLGTGRRYLQSIRIYSLSRKIASEYVLINPVIRSLNHSRHDNDNNNTLMDHTMTVEYETVIYRQSSTDQVNGFAQDNYYSKTPSPLSRPGATKSILGPGGLIGSAGSVIKNLSEGNLLSAAVGFRRTQQQFKGTKIKDLALAEVKGITKDILRGQNPNSRISVPTLNNIGTNTKGATGATVNRPSTAVTSTPKITSQELNQTLL
jgi:hypothetical protein